MAANRRIEVNHTGGFGVGWVAAAIFFAGYFIAISFPSDKQVDCFLKVQAACQEIERTYQIKAITNE